MKARLFSLLLLLSPCMVHADEPVTGAYAGGAIGEAKLRNYDLFSSDFEASGVGYKALIGYRINNGLAFEASYTDFGTMDTNFRGGRLVGQIDAFSAAVVGLIRLRRVDLFGKAGFAAWDGTLRFDPARGQDSENDIGSMLGLGVQVRSGPLAFRAEFEALRVDLDADSKSGGSADWVDLLSIGASYRF